MVKISTFVGTFTSASVSVIESWRVFWATVAVWLVLLNGENESSGSGHVVISDWDGQVVEAALKFQLVLLLSDACTSWPYFDSVEPSNVWVVSSDGKYCDVLRAVSVEESLEDSWFWIIRAGFRFLEPDPLGPITKIVSMILIVVWVKVNTLSWRRSDDSGQRVRGDDDSVSEGCDKKQAG